MGVVLSSIIGMDEKCLLFLMWVVSFRLFIIGMCRLVRIMLIVVCLWVISVSVFFLLLVLSM